MCESVLSKCAEDAHATKSTESSAIPDLRITQGIVSEAPLDLLSSPTTRNTKKNVELVHEFPFLLFFLTLLFEQVLGFLRDP